MQNNKLEELLSVKQVGDLLQPYLPNINAYALLKKDSKRDNPLLAFSVANGETYYRTSDVRHFLHTLLKGMKQYREHHQAEEMSAHTPQLRRTSDRRHLVQRRSSIVTRLSKKFERRFDDNPARRSTIQRERRQNFSDTH